MEVFLPVRDAVETDVCIGVPIVTALFIVYHLEDPWVRVPPPRAISVLLSFSKPQATFLVIAIPIKQVESRVLRNVISAVVCPASRISGRKQDWQRDSLRESPVSDGRLICVQ